MKKNMWYLISSVVIIISLVFITGSVGSSQSNEKIARLKALFRSGIKYNNIESINNFKELLLGKWELPPSEELSLMSNGNFNIIDYNSKKTTSSGLWKLEKNVLFVKHMNRDWESNVIKFVVFYDDSNESDKGIYNYTFHIVFQQQKSLGNVLVYESN